MTKKDEMPCTCVQSVSITSYPEVMGVVGVINELCEKCLGWFGFVVRICRYIRRQAVELVVEKTWPGGKRKLKWLDKVMRIR